MCKFFQSVIRFFYRIFCPVAMHWWAFWSNIRFGKTIRTDLTLLQKEDHVTSMSEIKDLANRVFDKFQWTRDGADQLWDAIVPPPQNYKNYLDGIIRDDCDGFHSTMHYCLFNSFMPCSLLSVIARGGSHCVLLFKYKYDWYVNDYNNVYGPYDTAAEAVEMYNAIFVEMYKPKSEVYYDGLVNYDYKTGRFFCPATSIETLLKRRRRMLKKIGD